MTDIVLQRKLRVITILGYAYMHTPSLSIPNITALAIPELRGPKRDTNVTIVTRSVSNYRKPTKPSEYV